jgi:RNA polymerase sigma-70 factor (ECF subfamily)
LKLGARRKKAHAEDPVLLARIGAGDLESLGDLFDRHGADVRRFLVRLGVDRGDVDDLVQLTFLEVVRAAVHFDGRISAKPWLLGIGATIVRRHRRSLAKAFVRVQAFLTHLRSSDPDTPAEALEGRETEQRVVRALDALSEKKREVFVLIALEGASGEEAARALGVPLNTIWTRLHHARRDLQSYLFEESR